MDNLLSIAPNELMSEQDLANQLPNDLNPITDMGVTNPPDMFSGMDNTSQNTDFYTPQELANIYATIDVFNSLISDLTPSIPSANAFAKNNKEQDILDATIETLVRLV